ncbi:MAG: hypothetical protein ACPK85_13505 [Methanosarcina sp.]
MNLEEENLQETNYYLRPEPGEKVPIQILNFKKQFAAWAPELKKTLYFEKSPEDDSLKRVREIVLLQAYDWLAGREGLIELNCTEFEQFMKVYEEFLEKFGEIRYFRQKKGRKTENLFELAESDYVIRELRKGPFSDKL